MKNKLQLPANADQARLRPFPTLCATLAAIAIVHASPLAAQGAVWTGAVGEWNDSAQWEGGVVPGETTNVFLPSAAVASYNLPMAAVSIGGVTNWGLLSINTGGFNCAAVVLNRPAGGGLLTVNSGGVLAITGALGICSNNAVTIQPGGSLTAGAAVHIGSNPFGVTGGATAGAFGRMTNNGGVITTPSTTFNPNNQSLAAGNHPLLVINGGVNNLGSVDIHRSGGTAQAALGAEGLMIYGGLVNMTSLRLGNNNFASMLVSPGSIVTNTGNGTIRNTTAGRPSRLLQTGGLYVTLGVQTMTVSTAAGAGATYSITGGTNLMDGLRFGDAATAGNPGTANFTNAAAVYIGSQGIANTGSAVVNARLNPGGLFGALADWTGSSPMILGAGDFTFRAASLDGTPHNITLDGVLSGVGTLVKTGAGTLTLNAAHTYTGPTLINEGKVSLGPWGSLASSELVTAAGAVFDVGAVPGYTLLAFRTIAGLGAVLGDTVVAANGIISPGASGVPGTLTFSNSLTVSGDALLRFDLPGAPGPGNDKLVVRGDLNVFGVNNNLQIVGGGAPGNVHALIEYDGSFNGDVSAFTLSGATGTLSHDAAARVIYLTITAAVRSPTNVTWVGNATVNDWDTMNSTNWLNAGALDFFVGGDHARFDATGAAHPGVNIVGAVLPGSVTVDAAADYTFGGAGAIGGSATLTKTNSGKLTVTSDQTFTGGVNIRGGAISVATLADAGMASPVGKSGPIVIDGGALEYTGGDVTWNRPVSFGGAGASLFVSANGALRASGALSGPGRLTKTGPGLLDLRSPNTYAGGTEVLNGALRMDRATAATLGSGPLTLAGGTDRVTFQFGGDLQSLPNTVQIVGANNLIAASGNNTITDVAGSGTLTIDGSGSTFTISGIMSGFTGRIAAGTLTNLRLHPSAGSAAAIFDLGAGACLLNNRNGNQTSFLGALLGGPSTIIEGASSENNPTTYIIGGRNTDSLFEGVIQERTTARLVNIVKEGAGKLTLTGASTYTGSTVISNGVLVVNGSLGDTPVTVHGGVLAGNGTLGGQVFVQSGGALSPGASLGTLTINNTLNLAGDVLIEVGKGASGNSNDVVIANAVNYGGRLTVTASGAPLAAGDSFPVFSTGAPAGDFAEIAGSPGTGLAWSFDPAAGVLSVVSAVAPVLNVTRTGNGLEFSWTGAFKLQSQTNSRAIGLGANWFDYPGGSASPVIVPITQANEAVFFRLVSAP